MHKIEIETKTLSDNSKVFNVIVHQGLNGFVVFEHSTSLNEAIKTADTLIKWTGYDLLDSTLNN